ncbi:MAG: hypothetical protein FJ095_21055, partial [Deltaproteobacteria bacterium]|nr:hypothetical protein [Deltaproteobacteria bacterium]
HDTTAFTFGRNTREGLGLLNSKKTQGFFAHVSLLLKAVVKIELDVPNAVVTLNN